MRLHCVVLRYRGIEDREVSIMFCFIECTNHVLCLTSPPPPHPSSVVTPVSTRDTKRPWLYQAPWYTLTSIIPWNHQGIIQPVCLSILDTCHILTLCQMPILYLFLVWSFIVNLVSIFRVTEVTCNRILTCMERLNKNRIIFGGRSGIVAQIFSYEKLSSCEDFPSSSCLMRSLKMCNQHLTHKCFRE